LSKNTQQLLKKSVSNKSVLLAVFYVSQVTNGAKRQNDGQLVNWASSNQSCLCNWGWSKL